ncbi:unnamed protein product, partial [Litomosoides sigmodontis]
SMELVEVPKLPTLADLRRHLGAEPLYLKALGDYLQNWSEVSSRFMSSGAQAMWSRAPAARTRSGVGPRQHSWTIQVPIAAVETPAAPEPFHYRQWKAYRRSTEKCWWRHRVTHTDMWFVLHAVRDLRAGGFMPRGQAKWLLPE